MTKLSKKEAVEFILKYGAPPPKPKPGYVASGPPPKQPGGAATTTPAPAAPATTTPGRRVLPGHGGRPATPSGGGRGGYGGDVGIIAMQHALQDLATDVSSQINLQDVTSGDPRKEKEAKERDAFGVFLTKNYMRNTKVKGVEYDPDPKVTDVSKKRPDDPTRMSVVMDTMYRIGNPKKGERFDDGTWGPRTNAAVRDAFAFASGLFEFVNDVNRFATRKLNIKSYTASELAKLEEYAKEDPNALTPQQKKAAAPEVTKHVKSIKNMYDEVKNQILQHPAYQQFIEGSVPFKSYYKVTPQQLSLLKKTFPQGIEVAFKDFASKITIDDLVNLDAVKAWMQRAAPDATKNGTLTPEAVVGAVWKAQEKLLGSDMGY